MSKTKTKSKYLTKITAIRALELIDEFLVRKISLMSQLEPTARVLGRMEAYKDMRNAFETAMKRSKVDRKSIKRADISHVEELSN